MKTRFNSGLGMVLLGLCVILVTLLFADLAHAQTPYVSASMQVNGNMGYMNPVLPFRFGVESMRSNYYVNTFGEFAWARKIETGDGYNISALTEAYWRHKRAFVGGGLSAVRGYTSAWSKGSLHPLVGAGVESEWLRMTARYKMKGNDSRNGAQSFGASFDWKLSQRWRFVNEFEYVRFYYTDVPDWHRQGVKMSYGVKYFLTPDRSTVHQ